MALNNEAQAIIRRRAGVGMVAALILSGCDQRKSQAQAPTADTKLDTTVVESARQSAEEKTLEVPAILVPDEPLPLGYLSPPPREMISGNPGRLVLGASVTKSPATRTGGPN